MRAAIRKTIHIIALAATLWVLASAQMGCGGEADVTVAPAPTPTRTPAP